MGEYCIVDVRAKTKICGKQLKDRHAFQASATTIDPNFVQSFFCVTQSRSFPHGNNNFLISSIVLSIAGFAMALGQASILGMCLGLVVLVVMSLATSKPMPQTALVMAAVASLAIAGYQVVEMRNLYKISNSATIQTLCTSLMSMQQQTDDDSFKSMYSEYMKYCGNGYMLVMLWHAVALVIWVACGVLVFLVPPVDRKEARIGVHDLDDHDYQKQADSSSTGEMA